MLKNTKEIQPILTAIYCINRTNGHEDQDITKLLDYAFRTILNSNTNMLVLACIQQSKQEMLPTIKKYLQENTNYKENK